MTKASKRPGKHATRRVAEIEETPEASPETFQPSSPQPAQRRDDVFSPPPGTDFDIARPRRQNPSPTPLENPQTPSLVARPTGLQTPPSSRRTTPLPFQLYNENHETRPPRLENEIRICIKSVSDELESEIFIRIKRGRDELEDDLELEADFGFNDMRIPVIKRLRVVYRR